MNDQDEHYRCCGIDVPDGGGWSWGDVLVSVLIAAMVAAAVVNIVL